VNMGCSIFSLFQSVRLIIIPVLSRWKDPLAIHHNLAWLYKKLCKNDLFSKEYSSIKYCKKAIKQYYYLIERYKKLNWYKDIVEVLIDMWEYNKAKQVYDVYLKKWGKKDSLIEDKF
jgi:hypothetical protein